MLKQVNIDFEKIEAIRKSKSFHKLYEKGFIDKVAFKNYSMIYDFNIRLARLKPQTRFYIIANRYQMKISAVKTIIRERECKRRRVICRNILKFKIKPPVKKI